MRQVSGNVIMQAGVRSFIIAFDVYVVLNILEKYDNKRPDPICLAYANMSPMLLTDRLGLSTDDECCKKSKLMGGEASGWLTCCDGRKIICVDHNNEENKKIKGMLDECTSEHEKVHIPQTPPCEPCSKPEKLRLRKNMDDYGAECEAYVAGLKCLKTKIKKCGNDSACRERIQQHIAHSESERYERCRAAILSSGNRS